ncbi:MFS transporter [Blastococcus sp. HT6-30]|uniref:MFS transporter n=1 Tax=Blastococcus sp. HT6-30 TaxID=3144843 RepID=UPI0032191519
MGAPGRARLAVTVVFAANGAVFGNWAVRIPTVKSDLGLSDAALGGALLVPAIGALVAMPLIGALSARFGSRTTTIASALLFFAVPVFLGLATSLPWLVPVLLVFGLAFGSLDVAMNAQAVTVERVLARPVMSSFHAAFSAGALAGSLTGSLAAAMDLGLAAHLGGTGLVLFLLTAPLFPALLREERIEGPAGPLFAWPRGRLLPLAVIALVVLLAEGAVGDWSAVHLRDELGASAGVAGLAYTAFSVTMVAGRLAGDRVVAAWGRVRTVRISALVATAGGVLVVAGPTVAVVLAGFAALGIGLACTVPLVFSAAAEGEAEAGPALAAVSTPGYLGFLLGPPVIGGLAELVGLSAALGLLPVLLAGVALLAGRTAPVRVTAGTRPAAVP